MKYLLSICIFVFSSHAFASGFKTESQIRSFSDNFINQIVSQKFKSAFDNAKQYWPIPAVEIDGIVNKIDQQWPIVQQRFGKAVGMEFIRQERIGNSFLRYFYLHKFENHAIYWRIDFYKPDDIWKINTVTFLDSLDALYE